jgi:hypothetical protein
MQNPFFWGWVLQCGVGLWNFHTNVGLAAQILVVSLSSGMSCGVACLVLCLVLFIFLCD